MKRFLSILAAACLLSFLAGATDGRGKVIKVLAIGNSFSQDAVEQYLWELGNADGVKMIVGNMYIGGCSLERHWQNLTGDIPAYAYRKVSLDGTRTDTGAFSLERALADEDWDYVSVQQVSGKSGIFETYEPYLDILIGYVRDRVPADCKILFHQTWAYQGDSKHGDFSKYGRNQDIMYHAIMQSVQKAVEAQPQIYKVVPSGTAVQNVRSSVIGDHVTRDGFHLDLNFGRFTAACAWYEILTGRNVTANGYRPESVSHEQEVIVKKAAHKAVRNPWSVTIIK